MRYLGTGNTRFAKKIMQQFGSVDAKRQTFFVPSLFARSNGDRRREGLITLLDSFA
jgi:hypothetical protein